MGVRRCALLLLLLGACGASAPKPAQDPTALGLRLASDARDWRAHRDLAKLRYDQGVWGEALREYLIVERQQKLAGESRGFLGRLLVARADARLQAGDPGALADLQHAQGLGAEVEPLLPESLALAALANLRHSSAFWQERATAQLRELAALHEGDPRSRQAALEELDPDGVVQVLQWFQSGGAKRQALRVAQHYVDAGGRDPDVLQQWIELHRWWYGHRRPALPSEAVAMTRAPQSDLQVFASAIVEELLNKDAGAATDLVQDWKLEAWAEDMDAIAQAYVDAPARADTLARLFVDQDVYGARRLAVVAVLFYRLGDPRRAKGMAIELAALSEAMPSYQLAAGLACAFDGELGLADEYFVRAAAASGDPGRYWAIAGRALRRAGYMLESIAANRRALALTAPGRDLQILLEVSLAQRALDRVDDAQRTQRAIVERLPEAERAAALQLIESAQVVSVHQAVASRAGVFLEPLQSELGF